MDPDGPREALDEVSNEELARELHARLFRHREVSWAGLVRAYLDHMLHIAPEEVLKYRPKER